MTVTFWPFHVCIFWGPLPPLVEKWRQQNGGPGSEGAASTLFGGGICGGKLIRKPTFPFKQEADELLKLVSSVLKVF